MEKEDNNSKAADNNHGNIQQEVHKRKPEEVQWQPQNVDDVVYATTHQAEAVSLIRKITTNIKLTIKIFFIFFHLP